MVRTKNGPWDGVECIIDVLTMFLPCSDIICAFITEQTMVNLILYNKKFNIYLV